LPEEKTLKCSGCKKYLPVSAFNKRKDHHRRYQYLCRPCGLASNRMNSQKRRLRAIAANIADMAPMGETSRKITHGLELLLTVQLGLLYPKGGNTISEIKRLNIIKDFIEEFKQALTRVNNRMRYLYGSDSATLLPNLRHQAKIDTAYGVLDASADDTDEQLKAAYMVLVKKHHPDHGGDAEEMKKVNHAHALILEDRHGSKDEVDVRHQASPSTAGTPQETQPEDVQAAGNQHSREGS
jgi:DnaJ-domain-containing protein 1